MFSSTQMVKGVFYQSPAYWSIARLSLQAQTHFIALSDFYKNGAYIGHSLWWKWVGWKLHFPICFQIRDGPKDLCALEMQKYSRVHCFVKALSQPLMGTDMHRGACSVSSYPSRLQACWATVTSGSPHTLGYKFIDLVTTHRLLQKLAFLGSE